MEPSVDQNWQDILALTYEQFLQQLVVFAPRLLGVVLLLLLGWLIALILSKAARSGIQFLDKFLTRLFPNIFSRTSVSVGIPYINFVGKCVFWLVMIFFIAAAANSLGLDIVSSWMSQLGLYLPKFAAGLLIIIAGYFASRVVKTMATSAAHSVQFMQAELLGRSVQAAIFFAAIVIGVEQLGINIQFFTQFFIVVTAVIIFGFSLAFGLGARELIANIIGVQQVQKFCRLGDHIKIGDVQGTLIEVTNTTLVLESENNRITIPAHLFLKEVGTIRNTTTANNPVKSDS